MTPASRSVLTPKAASEEKEYRQRNRLEVGQDYFFPSFFPSWSELLFFIVFGYSRRSSPPLVEFLEVVLFLPALEKYTKKKTPPRWGVSCYEVLISNTSGLLDFWTFGLDFKSGLRFGTFLS